MAEMTEGKRDVEGLDVLIANVTTTARAEGHARGCKLSTEDFNRHTDEAVDALRDRIRALRSELRVAQSNNRAHRTLLSRTKAALRAGAWWRGEIGVVSSRHFLECVLCGTIIDRQAVEVDKVPFEHLNSCIGRTLASEPGHEEGGEDG